MHCWSEYKVVQSLGKKFWRFLAKLNIYGNIPIFSEKNILLYYVYNKNSFEKNATRTPSVHLALAFIE